MALMFGTKKGITINQMFFVNILLNLCILPQAIAAMAKSTPEKPIVMPDAS